MRFWNDIVNEASSTSSDIINSTAKQVANILASNLKKVDKKEIKQNFAMLKKLNVLQVALNSIQDEF